MQPDSAKRDQSTRESGRQTLHGLPMQDDIALAVNAFNAANRALQNGNAAASKERQQHLRIIQLRYWRNFFAILLAAIARRRQNAPEFMDEERLYLDLGLVDAGMLGGDKLETQRTLLAELDDKGMSGCYYLTEWLVHLHQQVQLEDSLSGNKAAADTYASKLVEMRKRVLDRMSDLLAGLPGIPLEVSESMRGGVLDNAIIAAGISLLGHPSRRGFLRRRSLWNLREQLLSKARARASDATSLRLFDLLNEVYVRDWRERYEEYVNAAEAEPEAGERLVATATRGDSVIIGGSAGSDRLLNEAKQFQMRICLERAADGDIHPGYVLHSNAPRVTKPALAEVVQLLQTFDRSLNELPPIIIVPGSGRGFFAWETGCVIVSVQPIVGVDDSLATAFAWLRMLDDRLNQGERLRRAYEKAFPGATFRSDFPADYRTWFCRLSKGDAGAMTPDRRTFFRDAIGPDLSKPLLPPNLRNIGPQTVAVICRRLEKQLASGEGDVNLRRRLAALYWHQDKMEAAGMQFTAAMALAPNNGEVLFAAGMFMRAKGENEAANECFRRGADQATDSLWGVYCRDALANMF